MMLPVFSGQNFGYLYETETGHYLLHDKDFKTHIYLQGDDARIFREEIEHIDSLPPPHSNDGRLTKNIISLYLQMKKPSGLEEKPDGNFSHSDNNLFSAYSRSFPYSGRFIILRCIFQTKNIREIISANFSLLAIIENVESDIYRLCF